MKRKISKCAALQALQGLLWIGEICTTFNVKWAIHSSPSDGSIFACAAVARGWAEARCVNDMQTKYSLTDSGEAMLARLIEAFDSEVQP